MDFKYLQLKKAGDEESEDGGKINFYVVNKKYEYMKQFFSKEMFKNLLIVICLDLNKPDQLVKSFIEWHEYIMKIIKEFLEELDIQSRERVLKQFSDTIKRMKSLKGDPEEEYNEEE